MNILTNFDRTLIYVFLICSMLGVGLQTTAADLRTLFASRTFLVRLLLANFAAVPLAGFVLARAIPLAPETAGALLLLACTPGGVSALQFTTKIRGAAAYAGSSAGILSLLALLVSPLLLFAAHPEISFIVPYGRALLFISLLLLGPFAAGMLVRAKQEERAGNLAKLFVLVGTVAFVALILLLAGRRGQAMAMVGKTGMLSMFALILFAMAAGWLMSGGARIFRPVLAVVTSMRNAALCLLIAEYTFPGSGVEVPLVAFSALMIPPNLLLTAYALLQSRREEKRGGRAEGK